MTRHPSDDDFVPNPSRQPFAPGDPGLPDATAFLHWLGWLRETLESHSVTEQSGWYVRTPNPSVPGPRTAPLDSGSHAETTMPFLSIVLRTTGRRPQALREALLSVAAQSSTDFELLIVAHTSSSDDIKHIRALVAEQPPGLQSRTRVIPGSRISTATLMNQVLRQASGRYVSIMNEDVLFSHWVEESARLAQNFPGRTLRGVALDQRATTISIKKHEGVRGLDAPRSHSGEGFSVADYLSPTPTPAVGLAFPRFVHTKLGLKFDESMGTATVRDLLLRAAELTGVADVRDVVAIRYRWDAPESATPDDDGQESADDVDELLRRVDGRPFLASAGAISALLREKELVRENEWEAMLELAHALHQVSLKQTHIENLEAMLVSERLRVERLDTTANTQSAQIARLRRRVRSAREWAPATTAPPESRGQRLRRVANSLLRPR